MLAFIVPKQLGMDQIPIPNHHLCTCVPSDKLGISWKPLHCEIDFYQLLWKQLSIVIVSSNEDPAEGNLRSKEL